MDEQRRRFAEECGKEYPPLKDEDVDEFFEWLQSKKMTQQEFIEKALADIEDLKAALADVNYLKYKKYVEKSGGV